MPKPPLVPIVRKLVSSHNVGVVVSAGRMDKAVKVRIAAQEWNKKFRKSFPSPQTYLVADPNSSLVEGDVVRIASGWRTSKQKRHVVTAIVSPFGAPVEDRSPILTEEERLEIRIKQRIMKDVRSFAATGRETSKQRLAQARRQGHTIPSIEEAMANVKIAEEEGRIRREGKKGGKVIQGGKLEAHKGQTGQINTEKERRTETGRDTKDEKVAEQRLKEAKTQTA